ncbi:uncharacterized protein I303_107299 [Kwoniella dejecticola CBS 10117]|uniref:Uncharacterized protein n=1 Tax=Kwoniella dejecticola CBS 10117 TaxID=1296121 RepID=A0A1A5ZZ99_9TREE|nr:uncharacterized protein I303_06702 [Kwoniella dejecticola CBS 10117]OBR83143.1 hypothetical protein I303_06702 [Kwoniella dejecticola CBS 10117]
MASYQPIPSSDPLDLDSTPQHETDPSYRPLRRSVQEEFNRPPPSWWKRTLLILVILAMAWFSIWLGRKGMEEKGPTIIYANRYSDEHKYRPAASPVITEYLSGNRIRLRGASIGGVGIEEKDIPLTPVQKQARDKKRREEAKNKAREKMGLRVKKRKTLKEKKAEEEWKVRELEKRIKGL